MPRFLSLPAAALVVAICLSACGGSSAPAKTAASASASKAQQHANSMLALAKCIRSHGVPNFPDPSGNGGGIQVNRTPDGSMTVNGVAVNGPAFQDAMKKCSSEMPQGPPVSAAQLAKVRAGALKMATCMRNHGVTNFPDPVVKAGPGGRGIEMSVGGGAGGPNQQSPAFQKAQQACGAGAGSGVLRVHSGASSDAAGSTKSKASR